MTLALLITFGYDIKCKPMNWKKIFTNHLSGKRLIFKIYQELIQLNSKTQPTGSSNWAKGETIYVCMCIYIE